MSSEQQMTVDGELRQRSWVRPMTARSPDEVHRTATPLELFFDLVIVVAIAQAAAALHHAIVGDQVAAGLLGYAMVFFAIWWAWMQFTWFASGYDTDDVPYRLAVLLQLTGALILAAGVASMFSQADFTIVTIGYVIMRLAMVIQWLRAARTDTERRPTARRFIIGISVLQILWVALLFAPQGLTVPGFFVLVAFELLVPIWAEGATGTVWHAKHIAERYGLLTIIVLGESILAATLAIQSAIERDELTATLAPILIGGLLSVFSAWWLYFEHPTHEHLIKSVTRAFLWGYGHLLIFSSVAALGAGLAVAVDHATGHSEVTDAVAGYAVAIPAAIYVLCLWCLHELRRGRSRTPIWLAPLVALLILGTPRTSQPVLATGLLMAGFLAIKLVRRHRFVEQ